MSPYTKLSQIGEREFIKSVVPRESSRRGIILGIGDDAAVISPPEGKPVIITKDLLVEGVHFQTRWASGYQIGWKSLAVNLSDIAAMGGTPHHVLVGLGMPRETRIQWAKEFYRGIRALGNKYGIEVIGGDTIRSPKQIFISITAIGSIGKDHIKLRKGAKEGDVLFVSGFLGNAAAALDILGRKTKKKIKPQDARPILKSFHQPLPRVRLGQILAQSPGVTTLVDLSDGLAAALEQFQVLNKCGVEILIKALPVSPAMKKILPALSRSPLHYLVEGGEEYELMFTVSPGHVDSLQKRLSQEELPPAQAIGRVTGKKEIIYWDKSGKKLKLKFKGYDAFK